MQQVARAPLERREPIPPRVDRRQASRKAVEHRREPRPLAVAQRAQASCAGNELFRFAQVDRDRFGQTIARGGRHDGRRVAQLLAQPIDRGAQRRVRLVVLDVGPKAAHERFARQRPAFERERDHELQLALAQRQRLRPVEHAAFEHAHTRARRSRRAVGFDTPCQRQQHPGVAEALVGDRFDRSREGGLADRRGVRAGARDQRWSVVARQRRRDERGDRVEKRHADLGEPVERDLHEAARRIGIVLDQRDARVPQAQPAIVVLDGRIEWRGCPADAPAFPGHRFDDPVPGVQRRSSRGVIAVEPRAPGEKSQRVAVRRRPREARLVDVALACRAPQHGIAAQPVAHDLDLEALDGKQRRPFERNSGAREERIRGVDVAGDCNDRRKIRRQQRGALRAGVAERERFFQHDAGFARSFEHAQQHGVRGAIARDQLGIAVTLQRGAEAFDDLPERIRVGLCLALRQHADQDVARAQQRGRRQRLRERGVAG